MAEASGTIVLPWQRPAPAFLCGAEPRVGPCAQQKKRCAPLRQLRHTASMAQRLSKCEWHRKHFGGLTRTYFWNDGGERRSWRGAGIAEQSRSLLCPLSSFSTRDGSGGLGGRRQLIFSWGWPSLNLSTSPNGQFGGGRHHERWWNGSLWGPHLVLPRAEPFAGASFNTHVHFGSLSSPSGGSRTGFLAHRGETCAVTVGRVLRKVQTWFWVLWSPS